MYLDNSTAIQLPFRSCSGRDQTVINIEETMWTLISGTPSPFGRKVRIALAEKGINFNFQTEVPWNSTTSAPRYNPLEKLPVLILEDGKTAIYESSYILEWLEVKFPEHSLMPETADAKLFAKKVEVVCDGISEALVLAFFEEMREVEKQSRAWHERWVLFQSTSLSTVESDLSLTVHGSRQMRKVNGGLRALADWVDEAGGGEFLVGDKVTVADISICSCLGLLSSRWPDHGWQEKYPRLRAYSERLDARESFAKTRPVSQPIVDSVV